MPDRIARVFNRSEATQVVALDISNLSLTCWASSQTLMEFQIKYLVLFLLFSVIGGFRWFWMRSAYKNIQLMLEFLKGLSWFYTFNTIH